MTNLKIVLMALSASLGLVKQQIVRTFGRDTSVVDKEVVDIVLSNPKNKKELINKLNENHNSSIEIKIEGRKFSIVSND